MGSPSPMETVSLRKKHKSFWPKKTVRRWLNRRAEEEQWTSSSYEIYSKIPSRASASNAEAEQGHRCKSFSEKEDPIFMSGSLSGAYMDEYWSEADASGELRPSHYAAATSGPPLPAPSSGKEKLRMFVGTWNVAGRAPQDDLNLQDWLCRPSPSDIYVLGFQEVVPLNAGNVLGTEDKGPAARWLLLIRQALNSPVKSPARSSHGEDEVEQNGDDETANVDLDGRRRGGFGFYLAASKQMVGIFLCVWVRNDLVKDVARVKSSCVARGILGYMGNKGSISISMTLRHVTFCFICTHLASGENKKDEEKRNLDVVEILKKTRFPRSRRKASSDPSLSPKTILEHGKIIWLGDLNYRLAAGCSETQELLLKEDWTALLEKDQLRLEQKAGKIFSGWKEGNIYFPPTYKYLTDSDRYVAQTEQPKEKMRIPAWCDRILWRGNGMKQLCYVRGESRFSDHRPVCSIFSVRMDCDDAATATPAPKATLRCGSAVCERSILKVRPEETPPPPPQPPLGRTQSCRSTSSGYY